MKRVERVHGVSRHHHGALGAVFLDQSRRRVDVEDAALLDDGDTIAQPLRFFHQVRGEKHRLAAVANAAHQIPNRAARLRVETGRQLVEKHDLGLVDQCERDEQPLLLAAGQRHEPRLAFFGEPQLVEQAIAIRRGLAVQVCPQVHRFPHLDAFLELRLLQLDADA